MARPLLRIAALLPAFSFAQNIEEVAGKCRGETISYNDMFNKTDNAFCLLSHSSPDTTILDKVVANCCRQGDDLVVYQPIDAGDDLEEDWSSCHPMCIIENSAGTEDREIDSSSEFANCYREQASESSSRTLSVLCFDASSSNSSTSEDGNTGDGDKSDDSDADANPEEPTDIDDEVCAGEEVDMDDDFPIGIEGSFCLLPVLKSNTTAHKNFQSECCDQDESRIAPEYDEEGVLCMQVCKIKNGYGDDDQKGKAMEGMIACFEEHRGTYRERVRCYNGSSPKSTDSKDEEKDDKEDDGDGNDNEGGDNAEGGDEDQQDNGSQTNEDEDAGSDHAAPTLEIMLALGALIVAWQQI